MINGDALVILLVATLAVATATEIKRAGAAAFHATKHAIVHLIHPHAEQPVSEDSVPGSHLE